jgi:hypothetical protein
MKAKRKRAMIARAIARLNNIVVTSLESEFVGRDDVFDKAPLVHKDCVVVVVVVVLMVVAMLGHFLHVKSMDEVEFFSHGYYLLVVDFDNGVEPV